MYNKYELINYIIDKKKYTSYLELGLGERRETFDNIKCDYKIGVDNNPNTHPTHLLTTDEFFNTISTTYDVIYIDAYHEYKQVEKDFNHSIMRVPYSGCIFMHDIGPAQEKATVQTASGTAYMAWMDIRERNDLMTFSYQFNDGDIIGIILFGTNDRPLLEKPVHSWQYYANNKEILLNKKTLDEIDAILAQ